MTDQYDNHCMLGWNSKLVLKQPNRTKVNYMNTKRTLQSTQQALVLGLNSICLKLGLHKAQLVDGHEFNNRSDANDKIVT